MIADLNLDTLELLEQALMRLHVDWFGIEPQDEIRKVESLISYISCLKDEEARKILIAGDNLGRDYKVVG